MALRVLLIDDDARLSELLVGYLAPHGVALSRARDGVAGLSMIETDFFDAVLLDVMMPGIDGLEVLRRLRQKTKVPVIMLTARGVELGADDYMPKPFSPRELLARLRAVLRRAQPDAVGERVSAQDLVLDVGSRRTTVGGREVELTGIEFDILVALVRRAGRVVPRGALLDEAGRGDVAVGERTVDVHVKRLREKLGEAGAYIETVRGVGYRFRDQPDEIAAG